MNEITSFLSANPLIALAIAILLIILVLSILKKLFKIALIVGIILLLVGGAVNHFAREQFDMHGKAFLDKGRELLREGKEKVEKTIADELASPSAEDSTTHKAVPKGSKKSHPKTAAKRSREI